MSDDAHGQNEPKADTKKPTFLETSAIGDAATSFIQRVDSLGDTMPLSLAALKTAQAAADAELNAHVASIVGRKMGTFSVMNRPDFFGGLIP
jgi:hypothetical protein